MYEKAKYLIVSEIAIVEKQTEEKVEERIDEALEEGAWRSRRSERTPRERANVHNFPDAGRRCRRTLLPVLAAVPLTA